MQATNTIDEIIKTDNNEYFNYKEYRELLVNKIIELENIYYKISKLNMKSLELFNRRIHIKNKLGVIKEEIQYFNELLNQVDKKVLGKKNKNNAVAEVNFSNQIISLDYRFKMKSYELFNLLRLESDIQNRISIMNKLKQIYSNLLP